MEGTRAYEPPWSSVSIYDRGGLYKSDYSDPDRSPPTNVARLYPNVRGCGYPPELNCENFFDTYKHNTTDFPCWVSTMDSSVAITQLDLERAKSEVLFSLIPLLIFIVFVLYAFCRMGVFAVCNPMKMCPNSPDTKVDLPNITPKKLLNYKRGLAAKKNQALAAFQVVDPAPPEGGFFDPPGGASGGIAIPATITEEPSREDLSGASSAVMPGDRGSNPPAVKVEDKSSAGKNNQVVTSAEVLPRKLSFRGIDEDDLTRLEQELFQNNPGKGYNPEKGDHPFSRSFRSDRSDTETVINELFGEELEKMDRERLADSYDVLDLKDLETYDAGPWIIRDSKSGASTTMRRRRSKSPPAGSLHSLWDYDDLDPQNEGGHDPYAGMQGSNPGPTAHNTQQPSSTTATTMASGRAKYL